MNQKWDTEAVGRDHKESGILRRTIALVDASFRAGSNDRSAKLGHGNMTFATAILGYDSESKRISTGDGTTDPITRCPFEPDNWMLRLNRGFDNVWAVRLICDKENKAATRSNRSTHVIDQGGDQHFGQLGDLFWIVERGVSTDYGINGGGYWQSGGGSRDALALSIARNEAFVTDGSQLGQLSHVFTFFTDASENPDVPTTDTTNPGGGPVQTPRGGVPTVDPNNKKGAILQQDPQFNTSGGRIDPNLPPGTSIKPPQTETEPRHQETLGEILERQRQERFDREQRQQQNQQDQEGQ